MKNTQKYIMLFFMAITLFFVSCEKEKDSEDLSRLTFFPDFSMEGSSTMFLKVGETYNEPGVTAEENGQSISVETSVSGTYFGSSGNVKTDTPDKYEISYSALNSDGYPGSVSRTVYVTGDGDFVNSIDGLYTSSIARDGVTDSQYENLEYIIVSKTGENTYTFSDAIGGYYDLGRGYGSGYAAQGMEITADIAGNSFSASGSIGVGAFGGELTFSEMSIDAESKTITLITEWSFGYVFEVTLTKVEL